MNFYRSTINFLFASLLAFTTSLLADVKISNLDDFNFGLYSGFGNLNDNDRVCVNAIPFSRYQITFTGNGPGGAFQVSNGVDTLDYLVRFRHRALNNGTRVNPGVPLTRRRRASTTLDCINGLNANINIRFRTADLQAANPGRYIGLLTVTVAPE